MSKISQMTLKNTLVGNDVVAILDSEDSYSNKKALAGAVNAQIVSTDTTSTTATLTLAENTCYTFSQPLTSLTLSNYINSTKEIEIQFTTASSFVFTAPVWTNYWIGGAPTFEANKTYILAIKNGYIIAGNL